MNKWWLLYGIKMGVMMLLWVALCAYVVEILWNELLPYIANFRPINYWQALGLLILSRLLFGGLRFGGFKSEHHKKHWKKKWENHLNKMSPEARERYKEKWAKKCGYWNEENNETTTEPKTNVTE